jgi:hypothetical protein
MEEEEEKRIDLKKHRSYDFISPKFIIRFIFIIGAVIFLFFQLIHILESKQGTPSEEKSIEKDTVNIEVEIDSL